MGITYCPRSRTNELLRAPDVTLYAFVRTPRACHCCGKVARKKDVDTCCYLPSLGITATHYVVLEPVVLLITLPGAYATTDTLQLLLFVLDMPLLWALLCLLSHLITIPR